jgi:linoleoyl-CoA desaturase
MNSTTHPTSQHTHEDFQRVLFQRVHDAFPRHEWTQLNLAWRIKLWVSCALILLGYSLYVVCSHPAWVVVSSLVFSLGGVSLAFNTTHDCAHSAAAFSSLERVLAQLALGLFGSSHRFWRENHSNHHAHVNVVGRDHDLALGGLLRTSPHQPWRWYYRFQPYYWMFSYALLTCWMAAASAVKHVHESRQGGLCWRDYTFFWGGRVMCLMFLLVIPAVLHGGWVAFFWLASVHVLVSSSIAFVFQVSHVNTVAKTHVESTQVKSPSHWAHQQLESTVNFSIQNRALQWWIGGVGFHVEHHLFPPMNHIHLSRIQSVVAQTCHEFGVPYTCFPSFGSALRSHATRLKQLSRLDGE